MANRVIEKIPLSKQTVKNIREHYSIRGLARETGFGEKTIRNYLNRHEMPAYMWRRIFPIVIKHVKTKLIWARIGVSIPVTDDEFYKLCERGLRDHGILNRDVNLSCDSKIEERIEYGFIDGDSYIPGCCLEKYRKWFEKEKAKREKGER